MSVNGVNPEAERALLALLSARAALRKDEQERERAEVLSRQLAACIQRNDAADAVDLRLSCGVTVRLIYEREHDTSCPFVGVPLSGCECPICQPGGAARMEEESRLSLMEALDFEAARARRRNEP